MIFSIFILCRVIGLLLAKGYMELEETLMQWKQKTHLLRILEVRCEQHYVCMSYPRSPVNILR